MPLDRLLDTGRFDFDRASEHPGWLQVLRGEEEPETEEADAEKKSKIEEIDDESADKKEKKKS
mgnify:CR=1 FL=1